MSEWKPGEVLRITKLMNGEIEVSNDAWAVVLDHEDMVVYRFTEAQARNAPGGWSSQVCPLTWCGEETRLADADEVPGDIPPDFWQLSARVALA